MDCKEVRIELSSMVRGELSPRRRSEVEGHLASCDGCSWELAELESTLALVGAAGVSAPPQELRATILGTVEAANLSSLLSLAVEAPPRRIKEEVMAAARADSQEESSTVVPFVDRRRTQLARALAAAAILITGFVLGSALTADDGSGNKDLASVPEGHETQILQLQGMGPPDASVRHYRHDNFRVTLSVDGFEPTPSGFHYAVWVRGGAGDVAVGTFRLQRPDDFVIPFAVGVNPTEYPEFVVTREPNDGDPVLTGEILTKGSFDPVQVHHGTYDE